MDFNLDEFVSRSELKIENNKVSKETELRTKIIDTLFKEQFNWPINEDLDNASVRLEYTVQDGSQAKEIDYAFIVEDAVEAIIETKSPQNNLREKDRRQLHSYMRMTGSLIGVLTNGNDFELYVTQSRRPPKEKQLLKTPFYRLTDHMSELNILNAEEIIGGNSHVTANQASKNTDIDSDQLVSDHYISNIEEQIPSKMRNQLSQNPRDYIESMLESMRHDIQRTVNADDAEPVTDDSSFMSVVRKSYFHEGSGRVRIEQGTEKDVRELISKRSIWPIGEQLARKPPYIAIHIKNDEEEDVGIKYIAQVERLAPIDAYDGEYEHRLMNSAKQIVKLSRVWRMEDYIESQNDSYVVPKEITLEDIVDSKTMEELNGEKEINSDIKCV